MSTGSGATPLATASPWDNSPEEQGEQGKQEEREGEGERKREGEKERERERKPLGAGSPCILTLSSHVPDAATVKNRIVLCRESLK